MNEQPLRGLLAVFALTLVASGCAAEPAPAERSESPASADELEQDMAAEEPSRARAEPEPEPVAGVEAPDGLDALERQLAANNSRLRELGVVMPGEEAGELAEPDEAVTKTVESERPPQDKKDQPKAKKLKKKRKEAKPSKQPQARPSAPSANFDDIQAGGDAPRDEAKAVRLSPGGQPEGASACVEICTLSQGTCELQLAICELAERHDEEPDYRAACERAEDDCEVAKEACRACSE